MSTTGWNHQAKQPWQLRLIINSNFVGCSTGSRLGWLPSNLFDHAPPRVGTGSIRSAVGHQAARFARILSSGYVRQSIFCRQSFMNLFFIGSEQRSCRNDGACCAVSCFFEHRSNLSACLSRSNEFVDRVPLLDSGFLSIRGSRCSADSRARRPREFATVSLSNSRRLPANSEAIELTSRKVAARPG